MPNCRSIPPDAWAQAHESLLRYFLSRHGRTDAEDMAQETLYKILEREDYEFQETSDFLKVCLGFARNISREGFRAAKRTHATLEFDAAAPTHKSESHRATESRILLQEIIKTGSTELKDRQWQVIQNAILQGESPGDSSKEANRKRVYLHRARQRLRELTGWRKK